ncbi:MAG: DUF296 domain-containing protein [Peptoniphilus sp.]|nr:DUF296 domain-containing protein [Peptoniphilus sp.]MDD7362800.1 DUF296 domain-containing protein [Bacillota bacterium]MDY6044008.1 DUF296 domain-containing protein [Peptoniphilus sp.]
MDYRVYPNGTNPVIALRLDPGDEIVSLIMEVAEKENIQAATVSGLGATDDVTIGILDLASKQYTRTDMKEPFEITSFIGNLSRKDGEVYLHSHINLGGLDGIVRGGHLHRAVISVTAELFIRPFDGAIERKMNEEIGVNQMIF